MKVKLLIGSLLVSLLTPTAPMHAAETLPNEDGIYEGFFGHPLLAREGWEAAGGKWDGLNLIGQTVMQNIENVTDEDPSNSSSTGNLVDGDLVIGQTIVMRQQSADKQSFKGGVKVGFAISTSGNDFSLLSADVLKMFVIYFYNDGELVATKNAESEELDVLNLSVISIGGEGIQTLTVTAPDTDKDGNPMAFDSFGFGIGGVGADVLAKIAVHYAFIDEFEESPIIKKYFPEATSSVAGMVSGSKNLINNNLSDGATTTVLNVGGAYYTVNAGERLPFGAEVGFVISSGSLLDLNVGKAMQLVFLDKDGNEIAKHTQVDVAGVELIGGGKAGVNMVIPTAEELDGKEVWGIKLNRISVLDLDLGATVVHYAYVKLPQKKEAVYPFVVNMDVIPSSTYTYRSGLITKNENTSANKVLLKNDAEHPISFNDIPSSTSDTGSYWTHTTSGWEVVMTIAQTSPEFKTAGRVKISRDNKLLGGYNYKWAYAEGDHWFTTPTYVTTGDASFDAETGIIDLSTIGVTLESETEKAEAGMTVSRSYSLYFNKDDSTKPEDGLELNSDDVNIPSFSPLFEMAGTESMSSLAAADGSASAANSIDGLVQTDSYADYMIVDIPEMTDWKTYPSTVEIFAGSDAVKTLSYDAGGNRWISEGGAEPTAQFYENGIHKVVVMTVSPASNGGKFQSQSFRLVCTTALRDEYRAYLEGEYGAGNTVLASAMNAEKITGTPASATVEHALPVIEESSCDFSWRPYASECLKTDSKVSVKLNDASAGYRNATDNESLLPVNQWTGVDLAGNAGARAAQPMFRHVNFLTESSAENLATESYSTGLDGESIVISHSYSTLHSGLDKATVHQQTPMLTRAYVPVLPSGFSATEGAENYMPASYVVVEKPATTTISENLTTGIENVSATEAATEAEAEFYNLQGIRVAHPEAGRIYIVRRGNEVTKVMM